MQPARALMARALSLADQMGWRMGGRLETVRERDVFTDTGTLWRVREARVHQVPGAAAETCLIFDSVSVCRRLWTYPSRWAELADSALLELMQRLR